MGIAYRDAPGFYLTFFQISKSAPTSFLKVIDGIKMMGDYVHVASPPVYNYYFHMTSIYPIPSQPGPAIKAEQPGAQVDGESPLLMLQKWSFGNDLINQGFLCPHLP
jgi:hypothetical protein